MSLMPADPEKLLAARRQSILQYAKQLADEGAHYLWGADGSKPGAGGNVRLKKYKLDVNDLGHTTFCAATTRAQGEDLAMYDFVCAGRCSHPGMLGKKNPASGKIANPASDTELIRFVQQKDAIRNREVGWGDALTPRRVEGDSVTDYERAGKPELVGHVVWGEGCDDTRHFDCGSFVRHVVQRVCHVSIDGITRQNLAVWKNPWGQLMARNVAKGEPMLPADILVYPGHVAFAIDGGQKYDTGHEYFVAQAESAVYGVNYRKVHHGANTKCIRLSDTTLLGGVFVLPVTPGWVAGGPSPGMLLD